MTQCDLRLLDTLLVFVLALMKALGGGDGSTRVCQVLEWAYCAGRCTGPLHMTPDPVGTLR